MVLIVDDEAPIRDALAWLLKSRGHASREFDGAASFRAHLASLVHGIEEPSCVILDIRMPDANGLELFDHIRAAHLAPALPVIFLTGHADVPLAVSALKNGAFDFVEKPFNDNKLVDRVAEALAASAEHLGSARNRLALAARLDTLSRREREIMDLVLAGHYNKVIADRLNLAVRTVEVHRSRVFEKMGVKSAVELVSLLREGR